MKRLAIALVIILVAVYVITYLWARSHFPDLFPAR